MASDVTIDIVDPRFDSNTYLERAIEVFTTIESSCTRFDPTSPLMRANEDPLRWNRLPSIAIDVIKAAHKAYQSTSGIFDPRILGDLIKNGYDEKRIFDSNETGKFENPQTTLPVHPASQRSLPPWRPEFKEDKVLLGDLPIDLGGIGKGFAVQRAMEILQDYAGGVLINAGGDIAAEGFNGAGEIWRIGIENPWDPTGEPVLVVELEDTAIATSSVRLRSWIQDGHQSHHLIDPTTGLPGGDGLIAVSVIAPKTSLAEVWSKTLFLKGSDEIREYAGEHAVAAAWIDTDGKISSNGDFGDHSIWGVDFAPKKK